MNTKYKLKYVVTHNGMFHADDVYAIALVKMMKLPGYRKVIRTRDPALMEDAQLVIDVGFKYDGVKYFDHHQKEGCPTFSDGQKKAACSLVWDKFGEGWLLSELRDPEMTGYVFEKMHKFFKGISEWDNGNRHRGNVMNISEEISLMNISPTNDYIQDDMFSIIVKKRVDVLLLMIRRFCTVFGNITVLKNSVKASEDTKPVLVLPYGGLPISEVDTTGYTCLMYGTKNGFNIQAIRDITEDGVMKNRALADERIRGSSNIVLGSTRVEFVHASGFFATVATYSVDEAIAFALKYFK